MEYINRSLKISENPPLFSDYLSDYEKVRSFFTWHPREDMESCIESRLHHYTQRDAISGILNRQNSRWNPSAATLENLEKLSQPHTVAIVTGQQAGLYGGPLYTVYKILSIIKFAQSLHQTFPLYNFVPIFWMEVGDHDYEEINHFQVLDGKNQLMSLNLPAEPLDFRSIYKRSIPPAIQQVEEGLIQAFYPNDFRDAVLGRMKEIYTSGKSFADAFARWVHFLFGELGIIVVDPTDSEFVRNAQPLFVKAGESWEEIQKIFQTVNRDLEEKGYHSQIQLDPGQVFFFYEGDNESRTRVEGSTDGFQVLLPDESRKLSRKFIFDQIHEAPHRFTPNVALRPVMQDWLLPTVAYVAGPAEISYAAQLKPLYQYFGVIQPAFYPRIRVTIIEEKIKKTVEKLGLTIEQVFHNRTDIIHQLVRAESDKQIKAIFERTRKKIGKSLQEMNESLINIDRSLESNIVKSRENILDILEKLRHKTDEAFQRKMETEISQMNKILVNLFPQDNFQERVLNVLQYQVKYGPDFIRHLFRVIDVNDWNHQVIYV